MAKKTTKTTNELAFELGFNYIHHFNDLSGLCYVMDREAYQKYFSSKLTDKDVYGVGKTHEEAIADLKRKFKNV